MAKIKLGIIGTGMAAEYLHWPAIKKLLDRIEIVALCNRTPEKAQRFGKIVGCDQIYTDYHEMLEKTPIEAVLVSTPIFQNYPITRDCVKAGKHVLCEKPPGVNLEEAKKMIELANSTDRVILIGENYYYREDLKLAKEITDSDAIGELYLIRIDTLLKISAQESWTSRTWRIHPAHRGGIVSDAGVHHMATFRMFAGEPKQLSAFTLNIYPDVKDLDNLLLNLKFSNNLLGQYTATYTAILPEPCYFKMEIYGTKGSITVTDGKVETFYANKHKSEVTYFKNFDLGFTNQWVNFCDAIQKGEAVKGTAEQTYEDFALILKGLEAAEKKEVIKLT